jgi:hypothetical protein
MIFTFHCFLANPQKADVEVEKRATGGHFPKRLNKRAIK